MTSASKKWRDVRVELPPAGTICLTARLNTEWLEYEWVYRVLIFEPVAGSPAKWCWGDPYSTSGSKSPNYWMPCPIAEMTKEQKSEQDERQKEYRNQRIKRAKDELKRVLAV